VKQYFTCLAPMCSVAEFVCCMTASRRRRRYVRFPALTVSEPPSEAGRLAYPHSPRPPPSVHSGYNSWVPVRHKQPHYQVQKMPYGDSFSCCLHDRILSKYDV